MNVAGGLEKALAVALGDDLQAALDGAAPIYWRDLPDFTATANLPGTATPLSQHVRGPHALSRILSQVGVVETAEIAEQLMPDLQPGQCLVTLEGGAWRWDGLVVSPKAENASAIRLQQKNRLAEIESEVEKAQAQLDAVRADATAAKEQRTAAIDAVNAARQASRQAEETLGRLRKQMPATASRLTEITARLSSLTTSIENAQQDITQISEQLSEARESFAQLQDTTEAREKIAVTKTQLTAERELLATQQAVHAEIRREGEARTRRIAQIATDIEAWEGRAERVEFRLIELQERVEQANDVLRASPNARHRSKTKSKIC